MSELRQASRHDAPAASAARLRRGEVHLLWRRRDAREPLGALAASLSDDELRRSERFRRERDAHAFAFRRSFLRAVLASELGCAPREIAFGEGEFGKPRVLGAALDFSASSSGEWALVALALGRELGADAEHLASLPRDAEELSRLARHVLTDAERVELALLSRAERPRAFLRAWTRKEAFLKAIGLGLSREPSTVEAGLAPLAAARTLRDTLFRVGHARALDVPAPHGMAASLVAEALPGEDLLVVGSGLGP